MAVRAKKKKYKIKETSHGWAVCGFDVSLSSIAGAAVGYDSLLKKTRGPVFSLLRWEKDDDYFSRLHEAANSHEQVMGLISDLRLILDMKEIHIFQEEPWPLGMAKGSMSSYLKQQAEVSGAFLGGLMRWGYRNVAQRNSIQWRKLVADDLGVTTHHSKWRSPELAEKYNCNLKDSGKFRAKEWALTMQLPHWVAEIPEWPDIIGSADGKKPRPENSHAKAVQCDDRYDSLAIMESGYRELIDLGIL